MNGFAFGFAKTKKNEGGWSDLQRGKKRSWQDPFSQRYEFLLSVILCQILRIMQRTMSDIRHVHLVLV